MTTDIHLIVDALANSSLLEVQDDKIRRRSDWSKWVSLSGTTSIASPSSASMDSSMGERNIGGFSNKDADSEDQKKHGFLNAKVADEQVQDSHSCSLNRDLSALSIYEKPKSFAAHPIKSSKHEPSFRSGDFKVQKVKSKTHIPDSQNDFSSFGGDQSTFMLDEELELEHADHSRDGHKRGDDEDEDFFVDDQDVNRLIIVTQVGLQYVFCVPCYL
jgi:la-related protein 1